MKIVYIVLGIIAIAALSFSVIKDELSTVATLPSCGVYKTTGAIPDGVCPPWDYPNYPTWDGECPAETTLLWGCINDCANDFIDTWDTIMDGRCQDYRAAINVYNADIDGCSDNYDDCILIHTTSYCDLVCASCVEGADDIYTDAIADAEQAYEDAWAAGWATFNSCCQGCCVEE